MRCCGIAVVVLLNPMEFSAELVTGLFLLIELAFLEFSFVSVARVCGSEWGGVRR